MLAPEPPKLVPSCKLVVIGSDADEIYPNRFYGSWRDVVSEGGYAQHTVPTPLRHYDVINDKFVLQTVMNELARTLAACISPDAARLAVMGRVT